MKFGIKDKYVDELHGIFRQLPGMNRVVLYGSRARGDYRPASDFGICLLGNSISDNDLSVFYLNFITHIFLISLM